MNKRKKMRIRRRWQSTKKMKNCDPSRYLCMGTKGLLTSLFFISSNLRASVQSSSSLPDQAIENVLIITELTIEKQMNTDLKANF